MQANRSLAMAVVISSGYQSTRRTVNSSRGQLVTHASRQTVNSSQMSTEQSRQSLLCTRRTSSTDKCSNHDDVGLITSSEHTTKSTAVKWPAQRLMSSTCDRCSGQLLCSSVKEPSNSNYGTATANMHIRRGKKGAIAHTCSTSAGG